jgi:D-serine deaminase-like pyridoxal phosphate-dependent protein
MAQTRHLHQPLPTPALPLDLDMLEQNLDRMAKYCSQQGLGLRPPHQNSQDTRDCAHATWSFRGGRDET